MKKEIISQSDLEKTLVLTIDQEDIKPLYDKEVKNKRRTVALKGFRKGKTPRRMVEKMYGQGILLNIVNSLIDEHYQAAIEEEGLNVFGKPVPSDDQKMYTFTPGETDAYEFRFDIGLRPEIKLQGLGQTETLDVYDPQVPDEMAEEELVLASKRRGTQVEVDDVQENDILTLEGLELEGGELKKDGWETSFTVMINYLQDDVKEYLLKAEKGYSFDYNIYELEKDQSESYVKKYLLNMDEEEEIEVNPNFRFNLLKIERLEPADLDKDFFNAEFGEEVNTKEEALDKIKEGIKKFYDEQAVNILLNDAREKVIELNKFDMPEEFLVKYLAQENEEAEQDDIRKELDGVLQYFRWEFIKDQVAKDHEVKVEMADVRAHVAKKISKYLEGNNMMQLQSEEFVEGMVDNMLKEQENVRKEYEEVFTERILHALKDEFKLNKNPVSIEEFQKVIQELNAANAPKEEE